MIIKFETRAGQKFTVNVIKDIGHALETKIIKGGGKRFVGKFMVFAKKDMCVISDA